MARANPYWLDYSWKDQPVPEESLFDLVFDPNETNNLVDDTARQDILKALKAMRERLGGWMKARRDPFLNDGIHPLTEAVINRRNGPSPSEQT